MLEKLIVAAWLALLGLWLGLRAGLLHFSLFASGFSLVLIVAFVLGLVLTGVLIYRLYKSQPTKVSQVAFSLAGMLPIALLVFTLAPQARLFPPIHDISTDLNNPPQFLLAADDRHPKDHSVLYDVANVEPQQQGYPSLKLLSLQASEQAVIAAVEAVVKQLGWQQLGVSQQANWQLEAVSTTPLFGFKDDVVIRVTSRQFGGQSVTEVAIRSAARVGQSDLGANAKRIGDFYTALQTELGVK